MKRWLDETFAALAIRNYRIVWLGILGSFLAFFMSTVVQSVVAFELQGTNSAVGLVIFAQGVAMLVLGPLGGAFADRWPKRRVIAAGQLATAVVFSATAALVAAGAIRIWHLAAGSFVMGVCFAFLAPARQALVADLVPAGTRGNAMALTQIANNASRVLGPAVAGGLLAWPLVGAAGAYLTMAFLYLVTAASLALLPRSYGRGEITTNVLADVADGLRYVANERRLRILVMLYVAVIMAGFPYVTVMPGLVENELGRSAAAIGLPMGVAAIGGLIVSVVVARYADAPSAASIFSGLALLFGVTLFALAAAPSYSLAVAASFAIGAANGGFQTLASAVVIHETAPAYMGRVMSLTMMAFAGFGLMGLPIGFLADAIGERGALVVMGIGVCAIVAVAWTALLRAAPELPEAAPAAAEPVTAEPATAEAATD